MQDVHVYAPGSIIMFSEGEYSDFGYCGGVVTLKECKLHELVDEFKKQHEPKDEYDTPEPHEFVAWLIMTQACAPLEYQQAHLGSYGRLRL